MNRLQKKALLQIKRLLEENRIHSNKLINAVFSDESLPRGTDHKLNENLDDMNEWLAGIMDNEDLMNGNVVT